MIKQGWETKQERQDVNHYQNYVIVHTVILVSRILRGPQ